jgi:hypothetical protein
MRGWFVKLAVAMTTFAVGVAISAVCRIWQQASKPGRMESFHYSGVLRSCEWKLATNLISLHEREIAANGLKENSSNDFFWRWLKKEISTYQALPGYKQHSAVLPLTDDHRYRVELNQITGEEIDSFNTFFQREDLPPLKQGRCYVRVSVFLDGWICPNWGGVIDVDNSKLIHFNGSGG